MKKILSVFSYLFHPIFIPIYSCLFYFYINESFVSYLKYAIYLILFQVTILTIFIPITFFYLLRSLGKIDTIMASEISQRKLPLLFQSVLLTVLIYKGTTIDVVPELYFYFFGAIISTLLALIFLFLQIKTSLHLLGISSFLFFAVGLSIHNEVNFSAIIIALILLNGIVATSRLIMNAHNIKELSLGFLVGVVPQVAIWQFWL